MILHTVNKSPYNNHSFHDCLTLCSAGDSILLIEDGVFAALAQGQAAQKIDQQPTIKFYALKADVTARGLCNKLHAAITVVDDAGFVDLTISHRNIQSWY